MAELSLNGKKREIGTKGALNQMRKELIHLRDEVKSLKGLEKY